MTPNQLNAELEAFCSKMSEHTESIRIVTTFAQDGMTASSSHGRGNWYAQKGSVSDWIKRADNEELANQITAAIDGNDLR